MDPQALRFSTGQQLFLTLLEPASLPMETAVFRHEGDRLLVRVPRPLPPAAPFQLEWGPCFLLGEVISRSDQDGWTSWLHVRQGLFSTQSLSRLAEVLEAWR